MDIRQLQYFTAVVENGTISEAARKLHISQPPPCAGRLCFTAAREFVSLVGRENAGYRSRSLCIKGELFSPPKRRFHTLRKTFRISGKLQGT